ncbi:MAG TPA: hypothetical protein PKM17_02385, partial [Syntrophorhabdus sp.]|nr:hypothetical protein [Syntrophorhabdus sp.]
NPYLLVFLKTRQRASHIVITFFDRIHIFGYLSRHPNTKAVSYTVSRKKPFLGSVGNFINTTGDNSGCQ